MSHDSDCSRPVLSFDQIFFFFERFSTLDDPSERRAFVLYLTACNRTLEHLFNLARREPSDKITNASEFFRIFRTKVRSFFCATMVKVREVVDFAFFVNE